MSIPRPEYPRPQFERPDWKNLNGEWQFEFDFGITGRERGLIEADSLKDVITLPFCPESELSGIGYKDFIPCVWYKKKIDVKEEDLCGLKHIIFHIGACDWKTSFKRKICRHPYRRLCRFLLTSPTSSTRENIFYLRRDLLRTPALRRVLISSAGCSAPHHRYLADGMADASLSNQPATPPTSRQRSFMSKRPA